MIRLASSIRLALLGSLAAVGCASREHMSEDFGRQNREYYANQRVSSTPSQESPAGLDSEEAAAIRDRYRAGLGPEEKGKQADNLSRVLVLEEPSDAKKER